jgi:DNA-binding IclR family transcriptional regulator
MGNARQFVRITSPGSRLPFYFAARGRAICRALPRAGEVRHRATGRPDRGADALRRGGEAIKTPRRNLPLIHGACAINQEQTSGRT